MDIKTIAYRAACGLRDAKAKASGISVTEYLLRIEAKPERFVSVRDRESWVLRMIAYRVSARRRVWL